LAKAQISRPIGYRRTGSRASWSDQAFAFGQRRDAETRRLGLGYGAGYALTPARVVFDEIDQEAGIEIGQSHTFRSSSMAASVSSAVRGA
jgi:hypothetical protein